MECMTTWVWKEMSTLTYMSLADTLTAYSYLFFCWKINM